MAIEKVGCDTGWPVLAADEWLLGTLRRAALRDPAAMRPSPDEICELLSMDRHTEADVYANGLVLSLDAALGRQPVWHVPGMVDLSFDEAWLVRLVERSCALDTSSVAFLIAGRVTPPYCANIAFLVDGLATRVPQ